MKYSHDELSVWESSNRTIKRSKLVEGVGVNDLPFSTSIGKRNHPAYIAWSHMLKRCHNKTFQRKNPCYFGCTACEEWLVASNYLSWWKDNHVKGWSMDKDILTDAKQYSPENCIFVPNEINGFIANTNNRSNGLPIGVYLDKRKKFKKYQSVIAIGSKRKSLGIYSTPEEASMAWVNAKVGRALELKPLMDSIDLRIYPRVIELIHRM